jgi:hypothetical protein
MKKRSRFLLVVLLAFFLLVVAWVLIPSGPADPVYEGKPVSYWLSQPLACIFHRAV